MRFVQFLFFKHALEATVQGLAVCGSAIPCGGCEILLKKLRRSRYSFAIIKAACFDIGG